MKNVKTYFIVGIWIILICSMLVSFSDTVELYKSAGIDGGFNWLNRITYNWIGVNYLFSRELFASIGAEVGFLMGLFGLLNSHMQGIKTGFRTHWQEYMLFIMGLFIIGWSNVSETVGYNYLIGMPVKGYILGSSIPIFIFGSESVLAKTFIKKKTGESTQIGEKEDIDSDQLNTRKIITSLFTRILETGELKTGDTRNQNTSFGTRNSGEQETGELKTGESNSGVLETGEKETGIGESNSGEITKVINVDSDNSEDTVNDNNVETGELKTGEKNAGTRKSGEKSKEDAKLNTRNSNTSNREQSNYTRKIGGNTDNGETGITSLNDIRKTGELNSGELKTGESLNTRKNNVVEFKKSNTRKKTWTQKEYDYVKEVAERMWEENEKRGKKRKIGRPSLMKATKCSENLARKVIDDLRKEKERINKEEKGLTAKN